MHYKQLANTWKYKSLTLISGQKRQAYLTEIQRLKETGCLDPPGSGPRGSLTISDIRLPLKKEFVTKIGTASGRREIHPSSILLFIVENDLAIK